MTMRQCAVSQSTPYLAAPIRSANCFQVSYITSAGRTTRGKVTISLCTGMLRSISFRAMVLTFLLSGGDATVQIEGLAGDEVRGGRDEEEHRVGDIVRF